jgi:hypothetical protein
LAIRAHVADAAWTSGSAASLVAAIEHFLQHVDDFARIGALELDELADDFRRRDVDLVDDVHQAADDARVLGDEDARGLRQREKEV